MDPRARAANKFFKANPTVNLNSFIDETGHTGLNFLDESQPFFILGNAYSKKDIDLDGSDYFLEIHQKLGKNELHANVEGNKGLKSIEDPFISLIQELDVQFHFSVIEKKHYLKVIMFHHFYDNGPNKAVNSFALGVRALRMLLSLHFIQLVTDEHLKKYLQCFKEKNLKLYSEIHSDLAQKAMTSPFDLRTKELLFDALTYTSMYPKEVFESMSFDKIVAPNITAFVLMINEINGTFHHQTSFKKLVHDEQLEFGKNLKFAFEVFSSRHHPNNPTSFITDHRDAKALKNTKFELKPSINSYGLQTIDPALWLFKKNVFSDQDHSPKIWEEIIQRIHLSGLTFSMHVDEVTKNKIELERIPLSDEQLMKARKMIQFAEKNRWKNGT